MQNNEILQINALFKKTVLDTDLSDFVTC